MANPGTKISQPRRDEVSDVDAIGTHKGGARALLIGERALAFHCFGGSSNTKRSGGSPCVAENARLLGLELQPSEFDYPWVLSAALSNGLGGAERNKVRSVRTEEATPLSAAYWVSFRKRL